MRKRIAIISEHASPLALLGGVDSGGQNVYVGQVARHLAALGYEVDVFTRRDDPMLPEIADWVHGVRVIHVPAGPARQIRKEDLLPYMGKFTAYMLRCCSRKRRGYDLIHANFWMSALVAARIKRQLGIPFVVTFHALGRVRRKYQQEADGFPDERFEIEEMVAAEADRIIAECPQDEEDLIQLYNADPSKIEIVPCGFDPAEFWPISKPLARVALGLDPDERIILQLGRMVPRKGVDNVIRGLARLVHEHGIPARLLIVGGDSETPDPTSEPEIARLQQLATKEGVGDRVQFVGRRGRDALKYYYSSADVFVTTPWYEPFGITPLEAMASGTPVIGANVGGIKFSVRDGETGYLVPPDDPAALAERLAHLLRHPKLLGLFRRQAIRRANDLFTWRRATDAIAALYEDAMAASHPEWADAAELAATVDRGFEGLVSVVQESQRRLRAPIVEAAQEIVACLQKGGKILACGNGGSASDAQHLVGELVGRFKSDQRPPLPAIALTADTAVLTALGNDFGYERVFAQQVEALGRQGDVLIGISTSGRSPNLLRALEVARHKGLRSTALLGGDGGEARQLANIALVVPSSDTQHIQEIHIALLHLLCELVEQLLLAAAPTDGLVRTPGKRPSEPRIPTGGTKHHAA
jgi:D-inositol-3-phosphate glycosyltransferase